MKSSPTVLVLLMFIFLFIGSGCLGTYDTTIKSELRDLRGIGPIRALTVDTLLYTFETFSFTDSVLSGNGYLKQKDVTVPFNGSVPFNRIVFIERIDISYWKPVWIIPMLAGTIASIKSMLEESTEFKIQRSGSCPYIYSFDGEKFKMEAEAFGTSVSKAMEAQTFSLLPSLTAINDRLRVRISNERPETHMLNSVQLFAADAGNAVSVVLDTNNLCWPVYDAVPPSSARDHSGKDILAEISKIDGIYWISDLAHIAPFSGFRDQLELQFDLPHNISEATLIVHAINTDLITEAYRSIGTILGDATMEFYRTLEHDGQLQREIREWIHECSLQIEVAHGSTWEVAGVMPPEANVAPFSRAIRLAHLNNFKSPLRVRLSSLTDVWRIDGVSIDFSIVRPISMKSLEMISVTSSDKHNWKNAIKSNDSLYALLLPPHHIDLQFNSAPIHTMRKPIYVIAAQGYLYEWFPHGESSANNFLSNNISIDNRVAMLSLLIQQKDLFLPPIYTEWQKSNENDIRK